jgi:hypothetical protein
MTRAFSISSLVILVSSSASGQAQTKGSLLWEQRLPLARNPYGASASPIRVGDLLVLNHQGKEAYTDRWGGMLNFAAPDIIMEPAV